MSVGASSRFVWSMCCAPPPEDKHVLLRLHARAVHFALCSVILLMPVRVGRAWFAGIETIAAVHGVAKPTVFGLVILHIAGAPYQHFVAKTEVLRWVPRVEC